MVEQLHAEWQGRVRVVKFDVLAHTFTAIRFGVLSAPELIVFKGGQPVVRVHGYHPKPKLVALLAGHF